MLYKSERFSWGITTHSINRYKQRVTDGPEKRNASANDIRRIIRRALNSVNLDEIIDLEDTARLYPVKFTQWGSTYYVITQQDRVISVLTEEMYERSVESGNWKQNK